eukprot:1501161-Amphidinium_carterae.1
MEFFDLLAKWVPERYKSYDDQMVSRTACKHLTCLFGPSSFTFECKVILGEECFEIVAVMTTLFPWALKRHHEPKERDESQHKSSNDNIENVCK